MLKIARIGKTYPNAVRALDDLVDDKWVAVTN